LRVVCVYITIYHILKGQQGTYTTISGLRIVYVNVSPDIEADSDTWITEFPTLDADPSFNGVDLLLTCQWPKFVVPSDDPISTKVDDKASVCVAHIAKSVKPRYHFAATNGIFYERKPYSNWCLYRLRAVVTCSIGHSSAILLN
uniref:ZP domain-containing protein n=1 Tax=Mesocestoides corti TaxID=53468 RepID=A0A0R3UBG9_MESCO